MPGQRHLVRYPCYRLQYYFHISTNLELLIKIRRKKYALHKDEKRSGVVVVEKK